MGVNERERKIILLFFGVTKKTRLIGSWENRYVRRILGFVSCWMWTWAESCRNVHYKMCEEGSVEGPPLRLLEGRLFYLGDDMDGFRFGPLLEEYGIVRLTCGAIFTEDCLWPVQFTASEEVVRLIVLELYRCRIKQSIDDSLVQLGVEKGVGIEALWVCWVLTRRFELVDGEGQSLRTWFQSALDECPVSFIV